jgi:short-subunit dehydrogenase
MSQSIVLITGATSGIGHFTALHLAKKGHRVIATGRNEEALADLRTKGLEAIALDVTKRESIEGAVAEIDRMTAGHGVDVLVNNAGYGLFGPTEMLDDADVRAQFETNVFGLLALTRAIVPAMRARGRGRIVNVSSVGGRITFPMAGVYNATKYALESLSDALRMELAGFGIHVSVVEPGYIKTEFASRTMSLLAKYVDREGPYSEVLAEAAAMDASMGRFAVGPGPVARAIEAAATSRWPRARYVAPFYNALGPIFMALLPTFVTDAFFRWASGLSKMRALPPLQASTNATSAKPA